MWGTLCGNGDNNIPQVLKHKNELYVTNNDSVFVTCEEDNECKNHILEGAGIITLNETCRRYANRDVLIPGRIAQKTQYTDSFNHQ